MTRVDDERTAPPPTPLCAHASRGRSPLEPDQPWRAERRCEHPALPGQPARPGECRRLSDRRRGLDTDVPSLQRVSRASCSHVAVLQKTTCDRFCPTSPSVCPSVCPSRWKCTRVAVVPGAVSHWFAVSNAHPCFRPKLSEGKTFRFNVLIQLLTYLHLQTEPMITFEGIIFHTDGLAAF